MAAAVIASKTGDRARAGLGCGRAGLLLSVAAGAALFVPPVVLGQGIDMPVLEATTTADLNLRLGPGQEFDVVEVMPEGATVSVYGCLRPVTWCSLSVDGTRGWASATYLSYRVGDASFRLSRSPNPGGIPLTEYPPRPGASATIAAAATQAAPAPPAVTQRAALVQAAAPAAAPGPESTPAAQVGVGAGVEEGGYRALVPRVEPPEAYGGLWSALGGAYRLE